MEKIQDSCNFSAVHTLFKHISPLVSVLVFFLTQQTHFSSLPHAELPQSGPILLILSVYLSCFLYLPFHNPAHLVTTASLHHSLALLTPLFP